MKYKYYLPAFTCLMLLIYHSPSSLKEDIKTYTPVILKLLKDREMTCSYLFLFKAHGWFPQLPQRSHDKHKSSLKSKLFTEYLDVTTSELSCSLTSTSYGSWLKKTLIKYKV